MSGRSFLSYSLSSVFSNRVTSVSCAFGAITHFWFDVKSSKSSSPTFLELQLRQQGKEEQSDIQEDLRITGRTFLVPQRVQEEKLLISVGPFPVPIRLKRYAFATDESLSRSF